MLDSKFFRKINAEVIMRYRKHIFDPAGGGKGAKDVYGKSYKSYSSGYSKAKKTGRINSLGVPQHQKHKDSNAPVLTGLLMKDFQLIKLGKSGFTFGNLARQSTVKSLSKMGRVIMAENKALPTKVGNYVMKEADKYVNKQLGKIKGRTFNI
tara:strand:- start:140 stop:595 length:456 start_codon:yes stop_codon:yes gene_type:complete